MADEFDYCSFIGPTQYDLFCMALKWIEEVKKCLNVLQISYEPYGTFISFHEQFECRYINFRFWRMERMDRCGYSPRIKIGRTKLLENLHELVKKVAVFRPLPLPIANEIKYYFIGGEITDWLKSQ